MGHERTLFIVDIFTNKQTRSYVFRTRTAARAFAAKKGKQKNVVDTQLVRAVWGPDV